MLCLEDLSSNVLCRKEKSLWPNFLYPWGKHEICRWCGCWNACPLHKHWKGQWGNCSTSCIRWAATSFTVIVPDSCWKVLFGLNQHMSCAPHGQPSHLGCTDEQHTGACSGQWKSGGSNPLCMSLLNFECSLGAFKASLSDLAVSKQCPVSGHTLYAWMWCGVRHGSGSSWLPFALKKSPWWMAQVLFPLCLPKKPPSLVLFWYYPLLKENFISKSFSVLITAATQHHSAPWGAVQMQEGWDFLKGLAVF